MQARPTAGAATASATASALAPAAPAGEEEDGDMAPITVNMPQAAFKRWAHAPAPEAPAPPASVPQHEEEEEEDGDMVEVSAYSPSPSLSPASPFIPSAASSSMPALHAHSLVPAADRSSSCGVWWPDVAPADRPAVQATAFSASASGVEEEDGDMV